MKTELAALIVALVGANGFMLPSSQKFSTELSGEMRNSDWAYNAFGSVGQENFFYRDNDQSNDQIGSGWAYDPYGRNEQEGGKVPTQLVDEGDSWFYHPWGGVAQTDFYPMVCEQNWLSAIRRPSGYSNESFDLPLLFTVFDFFLIGTCRQSISCCRSNIPTSICPSSRRTCCW